ncbi:hypothetical protein AERO9AM_60011 [Aeromicrobium sp. 9AM]|nr:hypothetical protein [Aeromicrobium sp. 9AM]VXC29593.1 hypothetical protein AERO9AM_60011 [Aeromicrobium sp. 9AM]
MPRRPQIPHELRGAVFTTKQAAKVGVSASMLRGTHFVSVHRGVWRLTDTDLTFGLSVRAAALALPPGSAVSHVTALQWMGVGVGRRTPLHFSICSTAQVMHEIVLHRRLGRLAPRELRGLSVLGPDRSFVDSATLLSVRDLVRAGDALVRAGLTSTEQLLDYTKSSHLDGVVRAREAALLVRGRVDSPRETDVRLVLVLAGLPEPLINVNVFDDAGSWLARGDLVIPELRADHRARWLAPRTRCGAAAEGPPPARTHRGSRLDTHRHHSSRFPAPHCDRGPRVRGDGSMRLRQASPLLHRAVAPHRPQFVRL